MNTPGPETGYFAVSPLVLFPQTRGDFQVYLRQRGTYVLYCKRMQVFSSNHRQKLIKHKVSDIYIARSQKEEFEQYLEDNLRRIMHDSQAPLKTRAKIFYDVSAGLMKSMFHERLPQSVTRQEMDRLQGVVTAAVVFFSQQNSLRTVSPFISRDNMAFSHPLRTMIYCICIWRGYDLEREVITACGLGALLHDVGKLRLPPELRQVRESLDPAEKAQIEMHPAYGVSLCTLLPLDQPSISCIMFHHERSDGSGYPTGLREDDTPLPARVLAVADVFDNLVCGTPDMQGLSPLMALKHMRDEMEGLLDDGVLHRMALLLDRAGISNE